MFGYVRPVMDRLSQDGTRRGFRLCIAGCAMSWVRAMAFWQDVF